MSRWLILLPLLAPLAAAAPVPKANEKELIEKLFGKFTDPDKNCAVKLEGEAVTITLKGGTDYVYDDKSKNLPRLTREVKGDFAVTCRITVRLPKGAKANGDTGALVGGGLVVIDNDKRAYRLGVQHLSGDGERLAITVPGVSATSGLLTDDGTEYEVWTRLSRKGNKLMVSVSKQGLIWNEFITDYIEVTDKPVQVGVYALHNLTDNSAVTIDKFRFTQPKEEKQ
jgi:regulation of enolase protein 1 (concanavalin A-like superfamily)